MKPTTDARLKLSPAAVKAIRHRYQRRGESRITQATLARRYNVDQSTINQIVLGRSRQNVGGPRSTSGPDTSTRAHGRHNGRVKLTEREVHKIRALYAAQQPRVTQRQLAECYGVSSVCVCLIVNRKSWRYLANE